MEKTTTLELQKNKESMRRIFEEAWSKGKVEVLDELVAPTFKQHQYDRPSTREDFKAVIKEVRTAFPDLKVTAEDSVAGDDKVWMRVTFRGTHLGQFKGISPTGRRFEVTEFHIARFENGKGVEHWGVSDMSRLMEQLGITATRPVNSVGEQNKAMIRQYFELHNQKDLQKIESMVTPKHRFYFSGTPPMDWNGHKQFLTSMFNAFPDLHFTIEDILAEGDKVAFRLALTGTHKGTFQGIPPTGRKISFGGTAIGTIVDGKLEENRAHADIKGLMQQLGAIPARANAP